jgi:hypothetical protein
MTARLNVFQMLVRKWEAHHPYNAAQALRIAGSADVSAWTAAWGECLATSGLGRVVSDQRYYRFERAGDGGVACAAIADRCAFDEQMSQQLNRRFDPQELPLRPMLLTCAQGAGGETFYAVIVYRHWIADSVSIRMLLGDWLERVRHPGAGRSSAFRLPPRGYWGAMGPARNGWDGVEAFLNMARRHTRLRQARKVASTNLADPRTGFMTLAAPAGLADGLRRYARSRRVTVNDLLLASLAEACALHVPMQYRAKRRDLAVGSIVDLRRYCREDLSNTFGLYLGFTNVVCRPEHWRDFERLLRVVTAQTHHQKSDGVLASSIMWLTVALALGRLGRADDIYHFYRKELPLAGGLSNVHVDGAWPGESERALVLEYLRVSPTGPMTPVAFTVTTVRDRMSLGLTHRGGLIPAERAAAFGRTLMGRLTGLAEAAPAAGDRTSC